MWQAIAKYKAVNFVLTKESYIFKLSKTESEKYTRKNVDSVRYVFMNSSTRQEVTSVRFQTIAISDYNYTCCWFCFLRVLLLSEGRVAFMGSTQGALEFFNK